MRFEPLGPLHAARVFPELQDPALYAFIPDERPTSIEALAARYERLATAEPPGEVWLNWLAIAADAAIGTLQATLYPDDRAEVAWVIFPRYWRRGFGTIAAGWLLEELARRGATQAEASIDARNAASLALAAKLGFRPAGTRDGDLVLVRPL